MIPFITGLSPTLTLTSDASSEWGWGAVLQQAQPPNASQVHQYQGAWSKPLRLPTINDVILKAEAAWTERGRQIPTHLLQYARSLRATQPPEQPPTVHITSLEATATLFGTLCALPHLVRQKLLVKTDATAVVGALTKRASRSPLLNHIVLLIHLALKLVECPLAGVTHIAGADNTISDGLSRAWLPANAKLEWPIDRQIPRWLWESHFRDPLPNNLIDAFASSANSVSDTFWSYGPDPLAKAQDGLLQSWSDQQLWINPPFEIMNRVVAKLQTETPRRAIIISPLWPHRPWFHQLAMHPNIFATKTLHPKDVLQWGPTTNLPEPLRNPRWLLIAWALDSSKTPSTLAVDRRPSPPPGS